MNAPAESPPRLFGVRPYRPDGSMDMETLTYAQAIQDSGRFKYRWIARTQDRVHLEFLEAEAGAEASWQGRCACGWAEAFPLSHRPAWCGSCESAVVVTRVPAGWRWAGDSTWDLDRARAAGATARDPEKVWERHTVACLFGKAIREGLKLFCASALPLGVHVYYPEDERQPGDSAGFDAAAKKVAALREKNGTPAQAAGYPPLGTIRDAFTTEELKGSPFEEDPEEERREVEAKLRAGLAPPAPPVAPLNGAGPHLEREPVMRPTPRASISAVLPPCPVCGVKVYIETRCGSCERSVCWKCVTGDRADPGPCTDCNTAEENADQQPPHLSSEATEKARRALDAGTLIGHVCAEVGVDVLGSGPLGYLLGFSGARFRLSWADLNAWLRGSLTVGLEAEDPEDAELVAACSDEDEPTEPWTAEEPGIDDEESPDLEDRLARALRAGDHEDAAASTKPPADEAAAPDVCSACGKEIPQDHVRQLGRDGAVRCYACWPPKINPPGTGASGSTPPRDPEVPVPGPSVCGWCGKVPKLTALRPCPTCERQVCGGEECWDGRLCRDCAEGEAFEEVRQGKAPRPFGAKAVPPEVREVLARSTIDATSVRLPEGQLERSLYVAVNKALEAAGGKWNRKAKAHLFDRDPREALGLAIDTGVVVDRKKAFQAFYTPDALADRVAELAELGDGAIEVLEPSVGGGALVRAVGRRAPNAVVSCVEIDAEACAKLEREGHPFELVTCGDFLDFATPEELGCAAGFDRVVMNPPFAKRQDIAHVMHAVRFLRPGGVLVAIVSGGTLDGQAQANRDFAALVDETGEAFPVEAGAFSESGTEVRTTIIRLRAPAAPAAAPPPDSAEARKALGALWAPMKAHRATKKAPADPCPLCEKPIVKGATYRAGNAALGKALVHDLCVFRLAEGRDPRLSPQAALEEDAARAMASAGGE